MIKRFYTGFRNKEAVIKGTALLLLDIILTIACMVAALWMRFDFSFSSIDPIFWDSVSKYLWINVVCTVIVNACCKLYTSLWRFASIVETEECDHSNRHLLSAAVLWNETSQLSCSQKLYIYLCHAPVCEHYFSKICLSFSEDRL